jgi:hypothetical protein
MAAVLIGPTTKTTTTTTTTLGYHNLHLILLHNFAFHENPCPICCTLLKALKEFPPAIPQFETG